ncbi:MAG TPA: heavy metal translocating P-type ATPase [Syntrophobacteraceae bacterium]|nr:heavy metal translocating P-type ATPase [Syntrophobacteraceae bacterium]
MDNVSPTYTWEWEGVISGLDCADCAATLARDIEKMEGVKTASLNFATSRLRIEYDPASFTLKRMQKELRRAGYGLARQDEFQRAVVMIGGMDCADESTIIEKQLKRLAGVGDLKFNLVAREVVIEYDPSRVKLEDIIRAIDATGMKGRLGGSELAAESFWERHKHVVLTCLSGAFILAAFLFSWAGYPHAVTDPLYVLAMVTGGWFIARKGLMAVRTLSLDMNFLMMTAAIGAGVIEEWLEGASILFLFSVANILQNLTMNRARKAIRSLMELSPSEVIVRRNGRDERVPVDAVRIRETIVIRPGEKIGLDGRVVEGSSYVNQAPITGESMAVEKNPGDAVYAGTINQNGSLEVEVTHDHKDTTLSRIIHMVEEAQAQKAPSQGFVEEFAKYYTPAVIGAAVLVATVPPLAFGLPFDAWFYRALVLLVVSCPCALVISTPVSIVSGLTVAARNGVLIKGGVYLEKAGSLKTIAFDKTGTLTGGVPVVTDVVALNGHSEADVLTLAAAVECRSEHQIGAAIVREAAKRGISCAVPADFQAMTGKGVKARLNGRTLYIGNHRLIKELGKCSAVIDAKMLGFESERKTAVIVADEDQAVGIIAISDEVRAESRAAIEELKASGIEKIVMLTGDNHGTARAIAESLDVDEVHAEMMPEDKATIISKLMREHGKVAMVGDGVNDAPPMALATIGIAMGAIGTDTALETADIALMTDDLSRLPFLVRLSRKTVGTIKQNVVFSILVKAVFIILAVSGLATLWMAVGADMGASLLVIFNGLRLLAVKGKE